MDALTFCLLHGKWHDASCWGPLERELEQRGHRCVAQDLPFHDPRATHEQRARPALDALSGVEGPVAVVGHSLAAATAPLVAVGAGAAALVYLCPAPTGPFNVDVGVAPIQEGFPFPPNREDGTSAWDPDTAITAMYPRLPAATARALSRGLQPGASPPDAYPLDGSPDVRSALIAARDDEFFVLDWSRAVARELLGTEAIEIATGHFPMIEQPAELARLLEAAGA